MAKSNKNNFCGWNPLYCSLAIAAASGIGIYVGMRIMVSRYSKEIKKLKMDGEELKRDIDEISDNSNCDLYEKIR